MHPLVTVPWTQLSSFSHSSCRTTCHKSCSSIDLVLNCFRSPMTACISCNPNVPPLLLRLWWHSSQLCQMWICLHPSPPRRHLAFDSSAPKRPQQPAWQDWVPSDGSLPLPRRSTFRPQYQIQSLQMVFNRGYFWSSLWERFFGSSEKYVFPAHRNRKEGGVKAGATQDGTPPGAGSYLGK